MTGKTGFRCSICQKAYRTEAEAERCRNRGAVSPLYGSGQKVKSPFFFRDYPDASADMNRFVVVDAEHGFAPGPAGEPHDRRITVQMEDQPEVETVFLQSELEPRV